MPIHTSLKISGLLCCIFYLNISHANNYTFGIVPQQSASKLAASWVPVLNAISKDSGHTLVFKTAKNISQFEKKLSEGAYDFAFMNPYHYTVYHQTANYTAIAKAHGKLIKGIIVVKKNSPYTNLEDLNNKYIAFPAPAAFAASILTQAELKKRGIHFTPKYVTSHDSVYRNVAQGRLVAGGGVMHTLNNMNADIKSQIDVLWTSNGYTPHAIAAHSRVPSDAINSIQKAFVELTNSTENLDLLKKITLKGFDAAEDSDWDNVRNLKIEILE